MTAQPRLLPSGRYQGITYNPHAGKRGPTRTFDTEHEAYAWACATEREMDRAIRSHGIEVVRRGTPTTLAAYATAWTPGGPPATQQTYRCAARALAKMWPTQRIDHISKADVQAALFEMEAQGLATTTRTTRLSVARHLFRAAIADGLRDDDPTAGVRGPRQHRSSGKHRPVSEEELTRILAKLPPWMRAPVLLARDSGLRISEVAGLRWFRVDLLHATVVVADVLLMNGKVRDTPKGGKPATVPLSPRTVDALKAHMERWPGRSTDRAFTYPNKRGGLSYLDQRVIRREWKAALAAAKIDDPRPRFHDLRHTRGHTLAKAGVPIQVIQAVLRHESIAMTRVYMGEVPVADQARAIAMADGPRMLTAV